MELDTGTIIWIVVGVIALLALIAVIAWIATSNRRREAQVDARRQEAAEMRERAAEVDQHWFLGDFAAIGPEPVAVLEAVSRVEQSRFCRGNTDRYVVTGDRPPPALSRVQQEPSLIATYTNIAASFAWTQGYVTAAGWFDWLAELPA